MDESTTDAATQDPGVTEVTQPEEQPAEAETTPTSEPKQPDEPAEGDEPDQASDNSDDDSDYWTKKGIDISTPEGQAAAAKSYREAEQALSRKAQEASQLKKSIGDIPTTDGDERMRKLELTVAASEWKASKGLTTEQDSKMGEYLQANPQKLDLLKYGLVTLDDLYVMSGANSIGQPDPAALKSQGSKEALQTLANKQRATAPKGGASKPAGNDIKSLEERLADVKF
jgi:hypothetical protein